MDIRAPVAHCQKVSRRPAVLGIDLGTSAAKAMVLDSQGVPLGLGRCAYDMGERAATGEADTAAWVDSVAVAVREALAGGDFVVQGIGLSGQMHGVVALDGDAAPVRRPLIWTHRATRRVGDEIGRLITRYRSALVNPAPSAVTVALLSWLAAAEPENFQRIRHVLQPKDWLGFHLTGAVATEPTDASATGLWDFPSGAWHGDLIASLGLDLAAFPKIQPSAAVRGHLRPQTARRLGVDSGIPVALGLADVAASLVGCGRTLEPGQAVLTLGTGAQLSHAISGSPQPPAPGLMALAGPDSGQHYLMAGVRSGGLALDCVRRLWSLTWPDLFGAAFSVEPTADLPVFVPFLAGEPMFSSGLGAWHGLQTHHTMPEMVRAAVDGVAYTVRAARDRVLSDSQTSAISDITVVGGGFADARIVRLYSDVLATEIYDPQIPASSARGAAIVPAVMAGWKPSMRDAVAGFAGSCTRTLPDGESVRRHDRGYDRFAAYLGTSDGGTAHE